MGLVVLAFFFQNWPYNYIAKVIEFIEGLNSIQKELAIALIIGVYGVIFWMVGKLWLKYFKRIFN